MTYEELLGQIDAAGQTGQWSAWDLDMAKKNPAFGAGILSYKKDYASAADAAGKRAANDGAEALRRQYGSYLGGDDGSRYYGLGGPAGYQSPYQSRLDEALAGLERPTGYQDQIAATLDKMNHYGDFSYGPAPTYLNRYQQQLDGLLGKVQNYGPFSWSKEEDPSYAAYAKQYRREGDRATANALAQAASATGGQVSTAAMTAAGQAGDYYAGQLADKIPELYENAYQRYLGEYQLLADQLGQTRTAEQSEYAKYLDQLGQYNADRAQSYDQWLQGYNMLSNNAGIMHSQDNTEWNRRLDALGAYQGADETGYSRYLDQVNYNAQQDALAREQAAQQQSLYQQQVDAILAAGGSPGGGLVAGSGYDPMYVQAMENYYRQQAAGARAAGTGRAVVSRTAANDASGANGTGMDYGGLFAAAKASGNPQSFISNMYKKYGFTSSSGLWSDYKNWAEGQGESGGTRDYWSWSNPNTWGTPASGGSSGGTTAAKDNVTMIYENPLETGMMNKVFATGDGKELVYVDGFKPMTYDELMKRVNGGQIIEEQTANGLYHYRRR